MRSEGSITNQHSGGCLFAKQAGLLALLRTYARLHMIISHLICSSKGYAPSRPCCAGPMSGGSSSHADEASLLDGLAAHHQWLGFFAELWDSGAGARSSSPSSADSDSAASAEASALEAVLTRLLHQSLADPSRLSSHPAAAAPRFRLLALGLRVVGKGRGVGAALLCDRIVKAGLAWCVGGRSIVVWVHPGMQYQTAW